MSTDFKTLPSPSGPSSTPGPFRAAIGRPINSVAFAPYRHVQLGRIIRIDGEAVGIHFSETTVHLLPCHATVVTLEDTCPHGCRRKLFADL
jgi:hypothetical protein